MGEITDCAVTGSMSVAFLSHQQPLRSIPLNPTAKPHTDSTCWTGVRSTEKAAIKKRRCTPIHRCPQHSQHILQLGVSHSISNVFSLFQRLRWSKMVCKRGCLYEPFYCISSTLRARGFPSHSHRLSSRHASSQPNLLLPCHIVPWFCICSRTFLFP